MIYNVSCITTGINIINYISLVNTTRYSGHIFKLGSNGKNLVHIASLGLQDNHLQSIRPTSDIIIRQTPLSVFV